MKKSFKSLAFCVFVLSALKTLDAASFKSMPEIAGQTTCVIPFLVDRGSKYNQLNIAVNDNNSTFSAGNISLPVAHVSGGFWMQIKNLNIQPKQSEKYSALSCDYSICDLFGHKLSEGNMIGNDSLKGEPHNMHFALGHNPNFVDASWVSFNKNDMSLFVCTAPAVWNPFVGIGALPKADSELTMYVHKNIGKSLVSAGIPLDKAQLARDLQIMLISTQASKPTSFSNTIVCSLDGSAQIIENEGNLTDGVYIVLSKSLAELSNSATISDLKYFVYKKTGALIGSGAVNSFGLVSLPKGATIDGLLLFGSGFSNGMYPLKVSASKMPQLFLLQYPVVSLHGKDKKSKADTDAVVKQLHDDHVVLQEKIAGLTKRYNSDHNTYVPDYLSNLIIEHHNLIQSQAQLITLLSQQA